MLKMDLMDIIAYLKLETGRVKCVRLFVDHHLKTTID